MFSLPSTMSSRWRRMLLRLLGVTRSASERRLRGFVPDSTKAVTAAWI